MTVNELIEILKKYNGTEKVILITLDNEMYEQCARNIDVNKIGNVVEIEGR